MFTVRNGLIMGTRCKRGAIRLVAALLLAVGLGGCVYAPPYAAYDPYYAGYSYPAYVGPPVSLSLGFGYYEHRHSKHGYHGGYRGRYHGGYHGGYRHGWGYGRGRR